jgi:hypothetical protein
VETKELRISGELVVQASSSATMGAMEEEPLGAATLTLIKTINKMA